MNVDFGLPPRIDFASGIRILYRVAVASIVRMAKKKGEGFHAAAGLIRYFDQEDEKALKIPPWFVIFVAVAVAAVVIIAQWQWPV